MNPLLLCFTKLNVLFSRCYMFMSKYLKKERIDKRLVVQLLQQFVTISDAQVNLIILFKARMGEAIFLSSLSLTIF